MDLQARTPFNCRQEAATQEPSLKEGISIGDLKKI